MWNSFNSSYALFLDVSGPVGPPAYSAAATTPVYPQLHGQATVADTPPPYNPYTLDNEINANKKPDIVWKQICCTQHVKTDE